MEPQHVCVFKFSMVSLARIFHLCIRWLISWHPHSTELGQKFNSFSFHSAKSSSQSFEIVRNPTQNQMGNFKPEFLRWKISATAECVWIIDSMFDKNHLLYIIFVIIVLLLFGLQFVFGLLLCVFFFIYY